MSPKKPLRKKTGCKIIVGERIKKKVKKNFQLNLENSLSDNIKGIKKKTFKALFAQEIEQKV